MTEEGFEGGRRFAKNAATDERNERLGVSESYARGPTAMLESEGAGLAREWGASLARDYG